MAHLNGPVTHEQEGHVQRASSEVIDEDVVYVCLLVEVVRHSCSCRLLQHSNDLRDRGAVCVCVCVCVCACVCVVW